MTYEELKIKLDLYDPIDVLRSIGRRWNYSVGRHWNYCRFVICDDGDCHLFNADGTENTVRKVDSISIDMITDDVRKIVIPNSVTRIGNDAFWGCKYLTNVTIPDSVTSIGDGAFIYCSGLTSIMIPDSVTTIQYSAFAGCGALTNVTIGSGVTSIGRRAFDSCSELKSLIFKGKTMDEVKAMDNYPFGIEDESIIKCC